MFYSDTLVTYIKTQLNKIKLRITRPVPGKYATILTICRNQETEFSTYEFATKQKRRKDFLCYELNFWLNVIGDFICNINTNNSTQ